MPKSPRSIFCRSCGVAGARRFGRDARGRQRFHCSSCRRTFSRRTNTVRCGSRLSDREWRLVLRLFAMRTGISGTDLARLLSCNPKTGQRLNRALRLLTVDLHPVRLQGISEWDEACPLREQWVLGGVARDGGPCLLQCIPNRSEDTLVPLVERHTDPEGMVFTDEWGGYCGLLNRMTVCHQRGFVNPMARFVHTNAVEGVWGHLKPLCWHVYRGFPRRSLPQYLSEFMFRYNVRDYATRVTLLSALSCRRRINTLLV